LSSGPDLRAKVLAMLRSWRRDPYFVLLNPHLPLKVRRRAARRIAAAQTSPIRVTDPAVRAALREYPASARDQLLRQLLERALLEAGKEIRTPLPKIRLGKDYVKDKRGRICRSIAPIELSDAQMLRWLGQRVEQLIRLDLLGEANADRPRRALGRHERDALGIDYSESEIMLEYRPTPPPTPPTGRLSKREREVYALYLDGVSTADASR